MGGKSKPQTIGYWYRPLIHFGFCQGPADALLEFRGGDRTAWRGEQAESGQIYVDAMNLWGGESSEGGIAGHCDVMMGENDQAPNAYLAKHLGAKQPGYRGVASLVFKGGRYGAMNPYPKPASFKLLRVLKGWDDDSPWYPEKAMIFPGEGSQAYDGFWSYKVEDTDTADYSASGFDHSGWPVGRGGFGNYVPEGSALAVNTIVASGHGRTIWLRRKVRFVGQVTIDVYHDDGAWLWVNGVPVTLTSIQYFHSRATVQLTSATSVVALKVTDGVPLGTDNIFAGLAFQGGQGVLRAMNPAHIIYDSLVSAAMQGEPASTINDASFRTAADTLYDESFGLCTEYDPDAESVEAFRQRICNVIGAKCSRSRVDGMWYLDIIRADFDRESLPLLTDDDILEFQEEAGTVDDAVNQVTVEWFDPERKETRTTAPLQALGAIMAAQGVNAELVQYPEIPVEPLALRVGTRDLRAKSTPQRKFTLVCTRKPYAWRIGQRFRLQTTRRGIADMVCMVGESDSGTLRSGAVRLVAVQDFYALPDTTYLEGEPGGGTDDQTPQGAPQQRLLELPYVELAATLTHADLAAMPPDVGYIAALATAPRVGTHFALYTHADGEEFGEGSTGNWCPAATFAEEANFMDTSFTVTAQSGLSLAQVGSRVLWETEECRIDAIDVEAKTITLARGCADTVPQRHAPGTVAYFYDAWHAVDGREYADGEMVSAKLLTRTGTQVQPPDLAPTLTHVIAARAYRPYPPAAFRINSQPQPPYLFGALTASWAHRDRLLQADQLVDTETASVGPEAGTTYTLRWFLNGVLEHTETGVAGTSSGHTPSGDGMVRLEAESVRAGVTSYQMQVREFAYTTVEANPLLLENGFGPIRRENGDPLYLEHT